jgi:hypothetical protein
VNSGLISGLIVSGSAENEIAGSTIPQFNSLSCFILTARFLVISSSEKDLIEAVSRKIPLPWGLSSAFELSGLFDSEDSEDSDDSEDFVERRGDPARMSISRSLPRGSKPFVLPYQEM